MTAIEELVHRRLLDGPGPAEETDELIASLVREVDPLLSAAEVAGAVERVTARAFGMGPLTDLLADPAVTDLMVNGPGPVWIERAGLLQRSGVTVDLETIDRLVERILAPLGRRVDPVSPVADGRLPDGSRVHVVVPPLAVDGPCLTIRRFSARPIALSDVAPPDVVDLLRSAVRHRCNVLISGPTGSGKTTVLNALSASIGSTERVVTVEDAAELRLPGPHVVRLETRPGSVEGVPAVTARDLVRNALRMRPDRVIVGEVRGGEALDMVQAMNTGHDGSLSTIHANSCEDALRRLETLVLMAGVGLPLAAVRDHIASAVDLVVQLDRDARGLRRVCEVSEVIRPGSAPAAEGPTRRLADHRVLVGALTRLRSDGGRP